VQSKNQLLTKTFFSIALLAVDLIRDIQKNKISENWKYPPELRRIDGKIL